MTDSSTIRTLPSERLLSLDAYRGFIMCVLASGHFGITSAARRFPDSRVWQALRYQFDHARWTFDSISIVGCTLWDLIQPSFMFMAGVAMAYSYGSRKAHGQSYGRMLAHAVYRSIVLVLLGMFLRSISLSQTNFTFLDVVSQIGLGYTFLFLLCDKPRWVQFTTAIVILFVYWLLFALYPLPSANVDYASVGVPSDWQHLQGFAAHWDKGTNAAADFDVWFLNLFPRAERFGFDPGGYQTLNFIPSLATMIFGLMAGELLRGPRSKKEKFWFLLGSGITALVVGKMIDVVGICPIVKVIWTPSWAVFAAGWTLSFLAVFYGVIDWAGWQRWSFFLRVVGMNSIVMYIMSVLGRGFVKDSLQTHFGHDLFRNIATWTVGRDYTSIVQSVMVLAVLWLVCYWLYRQKIFIRI